MALRNPKASFYQELIDEDAKRDKLWFNYDLLLRAIFSKDNRKNRMTRRHPALEEVRLKYGSQSKEYRKLYYRLNRKNGSKQKSNRTPSAIPVDRESSEGFRWRNYGTGERSVS